MMIVIGLDPGTTESAMVVFDGKGITNIFMDDNYKIRELLSNKSHFSGAPVLAIEDVKSYGMTVGVSTFETVKWIGRFIEVWGEKDTVCIPRRDVKIHLCGSMKAKDKNISQVLKDRFGEPGTKKAPGKLYGISKHLWSALAVAVTCYELTLIKSGILPSEITYEGNV